VADTAAHPFYFYAQSKDRVSTVDTHPGLLRCLSQRYGG
jgi:hypothetical protein